MTFAEKKADKPVEKSGGGGLFEDEDDDDLFNETPEKPKKEEPPPKKVGTLSIARPSKHHFAAQSVTNKAYGIIGN